MITEHDVAVTVLSLRRARELSATLASMGPVPQLRVILNGADPAAYAEVMTEWDSRVEFVHNRRNLGVAAAFNQGIVTAPTRFVVLSGDDLAYTAGWMDQLLASLNQDDAPGQVSLSTPTAFSSFCVDKAFVAENGWFDHNFTRIYYEDEDWCLRLRERAGSGTAPGSAQDVVPRLDVVERPIHENAPWNSIPNRVYFWRKWERLAAPAADSIYLRQDIIVRRRLPEPSWPSLERVRADYQTGDFGPKTFTYDRPPLFQRALTTATTNAAFIGLRKVIQRRTNPRQELR